MDMPVLSEQGKPHPFRIWVCGPLQIERLSPQGYEPIPDSAWKGRRASRLMLKALLCAQGRHVQRSLLQEMLWGESPPKAALTVASSTLRHVLRDSAGVSMLWSDKQVLRLDSSLWCDFDACVALLQQAEQLGMTTDEAFPFLQQAEGYFRRGELFEGDDFPWMHSPRRAVASTRFFCRRWLTDVYVRRGLLVQAESLLTEHLQSDPLDEGAILRLMELLCQQSLQARALTLFMDSQKHFTSANRLMSKELLGYGESLKTKFVGPNERQV